MKTTLLLSLSTLWCSPKRRSLTLLLVHCALLGASTVRAQSPIVVGAWGGNGDGQTTVPLEVQRGVTAIAAGLYHTAALKDDGSVAAWGYNGYGQTFVPAAAQSAVVAISAGGFHTVVLKTDGSVVAWGDNSFGQTTVPLAAQSGVTAVAAGQAHTVALKNDGSVVAWGGNYNGQMTVPAAALRGVTAIAAGGYHTVALKTDGSVMAWGNNDYGQTTVPVAAQSGVVAIAAGGFHTVALKTDGSVLAWGSIASGGTTVPTAAQGGVTAIAAGGAHTVALKNDGSLVAWGDNGYGQTDVPVGLGRVTAIAAGNWHTVVLVIPTAPIITAQPISQTVNEWQSVSFTVTATGFPLYYQWRRDGVDLAGAMSATYSLTLTQTNQAGNYTVVVSNPAGSVPSAPPAVLTVNPAAPGSVVAWGWNVYGVTTVPAMAQSGVTAIATGGGDDNAGGQHPVHVAALKNDGTVVAWGYNGSGQVTGTPNGYPYSATASPVTLAGQV